MIACSTLVDDGLCVPSSQDRLYSVSPIELILSPGCALGGVAVISTLRSLSSSIFQLPHFYSHIPIFLVYLPLDQILAVT